MTLNVGTVLPVLLRAETVLTDATWMERQTAHDAVADFEVFDIWTDGDHSTGSFVRSYERRFGLRIEDARKDHAVGVTVGGYGDLDEEVWT